MAAFWNADELLSARSVLYCWSNTTSPSTSVTETMRYIYIKNTSAASYSWCHCFFMFLKICGIMKLKGQRMYMLDKFIQNTLMWSTINMLNCPTSNKHHSTKLVQHRKQLHGTLPTLEMPFCLLWMWKCMFLTSQYWEKRVEIIVSTETKSDLWTLVTKNKFEWLSLRWGQQPELNQL